VFLCLVSNIKVLVTASYVMGKGRTGVFVSVFALVGRLWNYRVTKDVSMAVLCRCIILKYPFLPLLEGQKCLKTMLEVFILHRQRCAYFL